MGPNGAGKTTLVRVLARLARPTAGRILLDGEDWLAAPPERQSEVGVMSHATFLYDGLTAAENLRFYGRLYGLDDPDRRAREALAGAGLEDLAGRRVGSLSRGQAQRVAIARACLHAPRLLLLDEPFTGLDPHAAGWLGTALAALAASGRTILLTTHDLARVPLAATRWLILVAGRIRAEGKWGGLPAGALAEVYERLVTGGERVTDGGTGG